MFSVVLASTVLLSALAAPLSFESSFPRSRNTIPTKTYSGYLDADASKTRHIFFVFQESLSPRAKALPVVVWFQGGPGCSGLFGMMAENGIFRITKQTTLEPFELSWLNYANVLWIEQPVGVGFSYDDTGNYKTNDTQAAIDSHGAIKSFFEQFPEYSNNDLWLTGESYGGVYIPSTAALIIDDPELAPRLKGLMLGNPVMRCDSLPAYAFGISVMYYHGIVSYDVFTKWTAAKCDVAQSQSRECNELYVRAQNEVGQIVQQTAGGPKTFPSLDPDDLYEDFCIGNGTLESFESIDEGCYPYMDRITKYFNYPDVQEALHARNVTWSSCASLPYTANIGSMMPYYRRIFDKAPNVRVMVYSGDVDVSTVPFTETQYCLNELRDIARPTANWGPWFYQGHTAGYFEETDKYVYATLKGAGHESPQYQPLTGLALFARFLNGEPLRYGGPKDAADNEAAIKSRRPKLLTEAALLRQMGLTSAPKL